MNSVTLASRAVLGAYARKVFRPIEIIGVVILAVLLIGVAYLAGTSSAWWFLLLVPVVAYGLIASIIWLIVKTIIDRLTPPQSPRQKEAVKAFIEVVGHNAELMGLSKFGLLVRVMQDVIRRSETNLVTRTIGESKELSAAFQHVISSFK